MSRNGDVVRLAAHVVTTYVQSNPVAVQDIAEVTRTLPALLTEVHATLARLLGEDSLDLEGSALDGGFGDLLAASASPAAAPAAHDHAAHDHVHERMPDMTANRAAASVPLEQSVAPGHLVCLEDGKHFKVLSKHLASAHGMTPEQYRAKWQLPDDYPMVASDHAKKRSEIALRIGLGMGGRGSRPANLEAVPAKSGRRKKGS